MQKRCIGLLDNSLRSILVTFFLVTFVVLLAVNWNIDGNGFAKYSRELIETVTNDEPDVEPAPGFIPLAATVLVPQVLYRQKRDCPTCEQLNQTLYLYDAQLVRNNILLLFRNRFNHSRMLVRRLNFLFAVPVAELSLLCFSFLCF
jgi:hypothetical protein